MVTRELNVKCYAALNLFIFLKKGKKKNALFKVSAGKRCLIDKYGNSSSLSCKEETTLMTTFPMGLQAHPAGTNYSWGGSPAGFMAICWGHL